MTVNVTIVSQPDGFCTVSVHVPGAVKVWLYACHVYGKSFAHTDMLWLAVNRGDADTVNVQVESQPVTVLGTVPVCVPAALNT